MAGSRGGRHGQITGQVGTPPPPGAPIEVAQPVDQAWVDQASRLARQSEKELPAFAPRGAGEGGAPTPEAVRARELDALMGGHARAKKPAVAHPPARQRPSVAPPAAGVIILTDADAPAPSADVALGAGATMTVHPPEAAHDPATRAALVSMGQAVLAAQHAQDEAEAAEAAGPGLAPAPGDLTPPGAAESVPVLLPADTVGSHNAATDNVTPPVVERPSAQALAGSKLAAAARDLTSHRTRSAQVESTSNDPVTAGPSRGQPKPVSDPGKQITGGFGEAIEAQYFPLDGNELREVVLGLMDKLAAQIQNDLRFSIAVVYPRVSAKVVVSIDCYAAEMSFEIPKRADHLKTPAAIAEQMGATAQTIVLENTIAEFSPDGESLVPPNVMRRELGLEIPRKQRVSTPTGYALVDRVAR